MDYYNTTDTTYNITTKILWKYYSHLQVYRPAVPTQHYMTLQSLLWLWVLWESHKVCWCTYIAWYFSHVQILFSHVIGKTAKRLIRKRAECKCEQSSKEDDKGKVLESELAQGAQWCLWHGEAGGELWWRLGPVIWLCTVWGLVLRDVLAWWGSDRDRSWLRGAGDEWQSQ